MDLPLSLTAPLSYHAEIEVYDLYMCVCVGGKQRYIGRNEGNVSISVCVYILSLSHCVCLHVCLYVCTYLVIEPLEATESCKVTSLDLNTITLR